MTSMDNVQSPWVDKSQTASGAIHGFGVREHQGTSAYTLRVQIATLRDRAVDVFRRTETLWREQQLEHLDGLTTQKATRDVPSLLGELSMERGFAWRDIAELVGVSVSAVRKWRTGGEASPSSRLQLAKLAAFLDLLEEYAVSDPASWMEMSFALPAGYSIRPFDLYLGGYYSELLEIAGTRRTVPEVLDEVDPSWRDRRSEFETYEAADGQRAIKRRAD